MAQATQANTANRQHPPQIVVDMRGQPTTAATSYRSAFFDLESDIADLDILAGIVSRRALETVGDMTFVDDQSVSSLSGDEVAEVLNLTSLLRREVGALKTKYLDAFEAAKD